MSKFIDADRLRAEINETINGIVADALDPDAGIETVASAKYKKDALSDVLALIDSLQQEQPATATGRVFTNPKPMNIIVENEQWEKLLGQFDNGQRVRIILVKEEDAE